MFKIFARTRPYIGLPVLALLTFGTGCEDDPTTADDDPRPVVFQDDFESGLSQWAGRSGVGNAEIVPDPLRQGNHVVRFTKTVAAGDIFGPGIIPDSAGAYIIEFDYLGLRQADSPPSNLGGFLGISLEMPGHHVWIAGTDADHALNKLEDTGAWESYSIRFGPSTLLGVAASDGFRIMIEDFELAGGVAQDAYFDNIRLLVAPE